MKNTPSHVTHTFGPVYNSSSQILILGSFPSVKSREIQFYYGHPRNRFWKIISEIFNSPFPSSKEEKISLILSNHLALWDVVGSCTITGSSDSSIGNVKVNDINRIISESEIKKIILNGSRAYDLFIKNCRTDSNITIEKLPSTSPANAAWKTDKLLCIWQKAIKAQ